MMVSFGRHGTGSAAAAVTYLLGERDAAGLERGHVAVLRGDPQLVADLVDSRNQVWRYTAGVIAWHRDGLPTPRSGRCWMTSKRLLLVGWPSR